MSMYAPSRIPAPGSADAAGPQLTDDERGKLQKIHELISLILKELPVMAQVTAQPYATAPLPAAPYAYSVFQLPWATYRVWPPA